MRPKAELVVATINALNLVVNYYFMMSHTMYHSVINDFEFLVTRAGYNITIYSKTGKPASYKHINYTLS